MQPHASKPVFPPLHPIDEKNGLTLPFWILYKANTLRLTPQLRMWYISRPVPSLSSCPPGFYDLFYVRRFHPAPALLFTAACRGCFRKSYRLNREENRERIFRLPWDTALQTHNSSPVFCENRPQRRPRRD